MLTSLLVRGKRPLNKLIDRRNRVVPLLREQPAIGVHPEQVNVIGRDSPFDQHLLFPTSTFFDFVTLTVLAELNTERDIDVAGSRGHALFHGRFPCFIRIASVRAKRLTPSQRSASLA